jgi:hypothetical protein
MHIAATHRPERREFGRMVSHAVGRSRSMCLTRIRNLLRLAPRAERARHFEFIRELLMKQMLKFNIAGMPALSLLLAFCFFFVFPLIPLVELRSPEVGRHSYTISYCFGIRIKAMRATYIQASVGAPGRTRYPIVPLSTLTIFSCDALKHHGSEYSQCLVSPWSCHPILVVRAHVEQMPHVPHLLPIQSLKPSRRRR